MHEKICEKWNFGPNYPYVTIFVKMMPYMLNFKTNLVLKCMCAYSYYECSCVYVYICVCMCMFGADFYISSIFYLRRKPDL